MEQGYYNLKGELVSKADFDKERAEIIAQRIKDAENEENLIDDINFDFYINELEKMS